ncbi:hypothetical protein GCM10011374_39800 [Kocuria dechangensis]|uniref:Uncharacterized protein n=2 Tax=Kocuria dechangensis TaxID=1176249 RepID=A0A917H8K2_9MICC|nr:hypothetical protein GCM10011374_39800 [Kocuria dechangensis]
MIRRTLPGVVGMAATTARLGRRLSWLLNSHADRPVPIEDAARRIAAFVHGNLLVLAALKWWLTH